MATNSKDIDQLIAVTDSYLSLDGRSKGRRRCRKESDVGLKNSTFLLQKDEHLDERIERLKNYSVDSIHLSKFLYDHVFNPTTDEDEYSENYISPEEKEYINMLLEKRKDINNRVCKITEENRKIEEKLFMEKIQLKGSTKERNEAWNKAVEVLNSLSTKPKNPLDIKSNSSLCSSVSSFSEEDNARAIYKMKAIWKAEEKYRLIQEVAGVLHKLISFSGIRWATEKSLLDTVLCTGKILNTPFNENNPRQLEKFVTDCMMKLGEAKWNLL